MNHNIFGTRYPIICSPMFQVSNVELPVAVSAAGCLPIFHIMYKSHIADFKTITNNSKFGVFIDVTFNYNIKYTNDVLQFLVEINPVVIEFSSNTNDSPLLQRIFELAKKNNIIMMEKLTYPKNSLADTVDIKGKESAGSPGSYLLKDFFKKQKMISKNICCSGGISTVEEIDWFLEQGAVAVVIGTAFALTKESPIVDEVKYKLIKKNSLDIEKIYNKNAIIFDKNQIIDQDDLNGTSGLRLGVRNQGGHVYMGNALNNINEIITVQELVNNLTKDSKFLNA
jgi:NAD(P)H-dependent flavin oxidoreductase YrpB (nitropropane dioxygenase family)